MDIRGFHGDGWSHGLLDHPKDGSSNILRNVGILRHCITSLHGVTAQKMATWNDRWNQKNLRWIICVNEEDDCDGKYEEYYDKVKNKANIVMKRRRRIKMVKRVMIKRKKMMTMMIVLNNLRLWWRLWRGRKLKMVKEGEEYEAKEREDENFDNEEENMVKRKIKVVLKIKVNETKIV